ncbi:MAG: glycine dehydrogenase subunit 2, partial [Synergistales bacterium]|nr:glycine dehydrogenase subunit 2 [Synergistales bacterium]
LVDMDVQKERYYLDYDRPECIGADKDFYGALPVQLKAYAWIRALGAEGLKEVARIATLNNNYMFKAITAIPGAEAPYAEGELRMEQVRYGWEKLCEETGVTTEDVQNRMFDYGVHYWTSHEPWLIPEPFTIEPTESYSRDELDEFIAITRQIVQEAHDDPDLLKHAPHKSTIHHVDHDYLDEPEKWAVTWRVYMKKFRDYFEPRT